ncbi:hypothetical protein G7043_13735 [Lentzea sp. NEAU-D13]|uniref:Peptidase inhibitor family I36 n=1 Tax=Lentzea alba TaxID=2714351 RepID=A0A7C9RP95_9PSEU|nr:hypothetical protein [Lentzea alba]NGY59985.1 hypothetical protein [Lentzea alba]
MRFNRRTTAVVGCAMLVATGLTTGTAGAADEAECPTPELTSVSAQLANPGRWAYQYHVTWCVVKGEITAVTPHITHADDGTTCDWVTSAEEKHVPLDDGTGAWEAFNMSEFSCKNGDGTDGTANPWAYINVWPNGSSKVMRKGIGDVVVD